MADNNKQNADRVDSLIKALQDQEKDEWTRGMAAQLLGEMGAEAEKAIPTLIIASKNESKWVRETALNAILEISIGSSQAAFTLIRFLEKNENNSDNDNNQEIVSYVFEVLQKIGLAAVPALVHTLKNGNYCYDAAYTLSRMYPLSQEAAETLKNVVEDKNKNNLKVRWMAAVALENTGLNMHTFFIENNLIPPRHVKCPEGAYFDVYNCQCIFYNDEPQSYYSSGDDRTNGTIIVWKTNRN